MNEVRKFKPSNIIVHLLLIVLVVINLFPLYWMLTFSLKTNDEILGHSYVDEATGERIRVEPNRVGLPKHWEWSNYSEAMNTGNMGQYFINSLVVAVLVILITLIASFMATYALTRLVWKGRKFMNKFFMLGLTIPIHAAIVPVYVILSRMKLLNTYAALIFPYAAFALSMGILISIGFMGDIPYDLDEAAFLDGCGVWGIFCRVIFPLMMPAVATVGIYTFLQCWNELLFATIFVSAGKYRTLPVGVQQLFGQYTTRWGPIGAALSIATLPTIIVYIFLSKRIQDSFIAGAVKG
ncbi:MAG: carbohydrate ABC transporter permease [Clostridia bacterium]|nr:carbohydrate ABC transporter permease [Clostridia bacterium]MBR0386627.1 carbohydrate ABC transporter permease [Clostridia bacterium]MBR2601412.1 carbohydrate ABC transporter permease [Clostridia bacterium]MBR2662827.1 carbohydrate ABC transporter permease [Clostridia bacterium]